MRIAVFGRPGGGKSTLAAQIASATGLPLHPLDLLQYQPDGIPVAPDEFERRHAQLLAEPRWVIDGFGNRNAFEAMVAAANVLVYVERPQWKHYWWVTKRFLKSPFAKPLGWPEGSPMLSSTISSYRFLRLSSRYWNDAMTSRLLAMQPAKRVFIVQHQSDVTKLLAELESMASKPQAD